MKDYMSINTPEYDLHFWNALRGRNHNPAFLSKGETSETGIHLLPASDGGKFLNYLKAESLFRRIGTVSLNPGFFSRPERFREITGTYSSPALASAFRSRYR